MHKPVPHSDLPKIVRERLLCLGAEPGDHCLVALSGGADSTALLLATLAGWSGDLTAAHLDHAVREGSAKEQEKVKSLCRGLGVELLTGCLDSYDVRTAAKQAGSLEAALRTCRYDFLMSSVDSVGARWLLTGHTADDQIETVLFRVFRRMDPGSLYGIPEKRSGILRPLLAIRRDTTLRYCLDMGTKPLVDPSNRDYRFARNRIRYRTIPALQATFHPDLENLVLRMSSLAKRMGKVEDALLLRVEGPVFKNENGIYKMSRYQGLPEALRAPAIGRFLYQGTKCRPTRTMVREALEHLYGEKRGKMSLPDGKIMDSGKNETYIYDSRQNEKLYIPEDTVKLKVPGAVIFEDSGVEITARYGMLEEHYRFPAGNTAWIRKKGLKGPLWVRRRRPGDRFSPLGMGNRTKKMKDFFIDRKIPLHERDKIPLVIDSEGEILWVAGVEISSKSALKGHRGEETIVLKMERTGWSSEG